MKTKTLYTRDAEKAGISRSPNFHRTGLQRLERTRHLLQHGSLNDIHYEKNKLLERFSELERYGGSKITLLQYSRRPFWLEEVRCYDRGRVGNEIIQGVVYSV